MNVEKGVRVGDPQQTGGVPSPPHSLSRRTLLVRGSALGGTLISATTLGSVLSACGSSSGGSTTSMAMPSHGGLLKAGISAEPDSLDPAKATLTVSTEVLDLVYNKLVNIDEKGKFVPELASKWHVEEERIWVFDLKEGVSFHDGEPLTPEDVKFTFERILDPKTASKYIASFGEVESIDVTGPAQVTFTLKKPFAPFLIGHANYGYIANQRSTEMVNAARNPVGTGPFKFVQWEQGNKISVQRNEQYFDRKLPYVNNLEMLVRPTDPSNIEAVRSGELNYLDSLPAQSIATVETDPTFNYVTTNTGGVVQFLSFNLADPVIKNRALRLAMTWAIDRQEILDVAFFGGGEIGSEEVPKGSQWYDGEDPYAGGPDLTKAKKYIEESGLETPITVEYLAWSSQPYPARIGEVIREQLKEIGVDFKITQLDQTTWLNRVLGGEFQATLIFNDRTVDPDDLFSQVFISNGAVNVLNYKDPRFDRLAAEARSTLDISRR